MYDNTYKQIQWSLGDIQNPPNDEYENFINAHMEVAAEYRPMKLRTKPRVPWETLTVRKKRDNMKTTSFCNKRNPTNANAQKLKKAQRELINAYQKEQIKYVQGQINKIRNSEEDRQSWIAWQTVNEVSKRKSTSRAKLSGKNISRICLETPQKL